MEMTKLIRFSTWAENVRARAKLRRSMGDGEVLAPRVVWPRISVQRQTRELFEYITEGDNGELSLGS